METELKKNETLFSKEIGKKEAQKLRAIHKRKRSVWAGLGTFGMVGWSVATPTVLGTVIGSWLDKKYPASLSWTLTFLIAGLFLGCFIAWQWVVKEDRSMHQKTEDNDE